VKVVVNNQLVNYRLNGQGKLIILLHGWGDNISGLKSLDEELAKFYQVLAIDLPGFGESELPKKPWRLNDYAQLVAGVIKKLELEEPFAAIGHSNGGAVLIKAVSQKIIIPSKLILIAASGVRTGQTLKRITLSIFAKTGNLATIWLPERYRMSLRSTLYGMAGSDMLIVPELRETFTLVVQEDLQSVASQISLPTLLIYAENDQAAPISVGKTYNKLINNSKLEIVASSGHFIHLDQPEQSF
jgi:pimeloyl-ACP methyl ester carboxylesterase